MKNHNQITEMLEIYRQNPEKVFALIYQAFSGPVFRYLRNSFTLSREEAEDILHNVFLPWVQNPQKFAGVENPAAYLFTSARNAALKKRAQPGEQSMMVEPTSDGHESQVEDSMLINRALSTLPEEQKEAVWNEPAGPGRFALPLLLALAMLMIVLGNISDSRVAEPVKGSEKAVPVIEKIVPETPPVIASAGLPENIGAAKLLRQYDNDLNLSFAEDDTGVLMLGSSRELDNI